MYMYYVYMIYVYICNRALSSWCQQVPPEPISARGVKDDGVHKLPHVIGFALHVSIYRTIYIYMATTGQRNTLYSILLNFPLVTICRFIH